MIIVKTHEELEVMREGGRLLANVMRHVVKEVGKGVTTKHLDTVAHTLIKHYEGRPSFLGYRGFPASICTSLNEEIVHGIPTHHRVLKDGDIVSIDIGLFHRGLHTDMAVTVPVGDVAQQYRDLIDTTRESLTCAIQHCVQGNTIGDIGFSVQHYVETRGFSVVREYVGHGIGRQLHEDPQIPNYGKLRTGARLIKGMAVALEPMVNVGTWKTRVKQDAWTVVTRDGAYSAHFEHTIIITDGEPEIITHL